MHHWGFSKKDNKVLNPDNSKLLLSGFFYCYLKLSKGFIDPFENIKRDLFYEEEEFALLAIIGGTGVYDLSIFEQVKEEIVQTPYGDRSILIGTVGTKKVAFMTRHGEGHKIPPHQINYRGNIFALKKLGVTNIIATTAVGSLDAEVGPGTFVFCDQFLDFTRNRVLTFFDGAPLPVVHVDVSHPYCEILRAELIDIAQEKELSFRATGTYVCTEGPRFESPAEVSFYGKIGGTVVGMTGIPEAVLAREAEICYTTISMVTNLGAGISKINLTHEEVLQVMEENKKNFHGLISLAIQKWAEKGECSCQSSLKEFGGFNYCIKGIL